jgi:hypothetical protein
MTIEVHDTPAKQATGISALFGAGQADLAAQQLRLRLPPESLSVFALQ